MAIASVSSDYTGRKKDISILQYPNAEIVPYGSSSTSFSKLIDNPSTVLPQFGKAVRFCTGVQKLVQRYAIILLTNLESQPNYLEFGTELLKTLNAGISPVDTLAASQIFNLASYTAVSVLKSYQSDHTDIPADERIAYATLTDVRLFGGMAAFDVSIRTDAGDLIDFIVPLPK